MDNSENVSTGTTPSITLRKGNTEIKIKDPSKLVRKIEEMFPKGVNKNLHSELIARELTQKKIEYGIGQEPFIDDDPLVVIPNDAPDVIPSFSQSEIRTVNKNAYEIRSDVLQKALDWVRWQTDTSIAISDRNDFGEGLRTDQLPNSDKVLEIAKKFYAFVENRR